VLGHRFVEFQVELQRWPLRLASTRAT